MAAKTTKAPVTAPGVASDKKKALETALAQIEKNYGKGAIMRLGEDIPVNVDAISTGSLSLDLALGVGGVPPPLSTWSTRWSRPMPAPSAWTSTPC